MNRQRTSRLIAIMNNVDQREEEPENVNIAPDKVKQRDVTTTIDKALIRSTHEYMLREPKKRTNYEENDVTEDFSPDESEYLPSPDRTSNILQLNSPSSIGGNSDYIETATEEIVNTPSTISNISFVFNTIDFIASPSVIYEADKISDNSKTKPECVLDLTPTGIYKIYQSPKNPAKSSKRCLNEWFQNLNQPSTSKANIKIDEHGKQDEQDPKSIDLDETLKPENISCTILSDSTISNKEGMISGYENLKRSLINNNNVHHQSSYQNEDLNDILVSENQAKANSNSTVQKLLENIYDSTSILPDKTVNGYEGITNQNNSGSDQQIPNSNDNILYSNTLDQETTFQNKKTRKRKQNIDTRQDIKSKRLKNSGESYIGCRSKKKYDKKALKASCNCTKKCGEKISHEQRENIMQQYYKIGDHERQWQYIVNHTIVEDVKRITLNRKRTRTQTIKYFFQIESDKIFVCKTFFINTLSISHQTVYTALEKSNNDENLIDKRGQHANRPRRMSIETEGSIKQHIELFPNVESHYVRKDTIRKYLSPLLNISKMYRLYRCWFEQQTFDFPMATKRQYETIFNTNYNYSFFKPKKDQCTQCTRYRQADSKTQEILQDKFNKHQHNKERIRQIKTKERESTNSSDTTIAIFDLEKVLSIPQSEVSAFHYKRKYPIYNFTVYDATNSKGYCYVWHAQIAKRGANEIGSCLWQFLHHEKERGVSNISFYSDGCYGQNKNRFIFALYIFASQKLRLNITHRFFETGHGQSEADSMHSNIERQLKHRIIYTPDQMYSTVMNSKVNGEKYNVKEMAQSEFYNLKELITNKNWAKDEDGQKILWTQIMEVSVAHSQPSVLKFKYDFDAEYSQINIEPVRRIRTKRATRELASPNPRDVTELQVLYTGPFPVSKALYDDLMCLCKSGDIPSYYHAFYESLTYHSNSGSNDDDEEDDQE